MPPPKGEDVDFAKAYKDLIEAEKTAATLEAQLNSLEQKLDDFLAKHDKEEEGGWKEQKNEGSPKALASDQDGIKKAEGP